MGGRKYALTLNYNRQVKAQWIDTDNGQGGRCIDNWQENIEGYKLGGK